MSRYTGGVLSATEPTIASPTNGEGGTASGVWSMSSVFSEEGGGTWPKRPLLKELYAWGDNSPNGQLGLGDTTDRSVPVQVGALTTWAKVTIGTAHTLSIKTDGTLWTWGDDSTGQLGLNLSNSADDSSPVQVGSLTTWLEVSGV